jgi:hypothetical protein
MHFNTAWSPATPVIEKLAEMFPACNFKLEYFECGMEFCGELLFEQGVKIGEMVGSYSGPRGG